MRTKRIDFTCVTVASSALGLDDARATSAMILEPADGLIVGDEVVGTFRGRIVHAVSGTANDQAARVAREFGFVR